jgi:hypothetical protein
MGTIVMNPVGGGQLTQDSPVFRPLVTKSGSKNLAQLALRYIFANPQVDTIIAGISCRRDIDEAIAAAEAPVLTAEIRSALADLVENLDLKNVNFCTKCGYCLPCPQEVNIPKVMEAIYQQRYLGFKETARKIYGRIAASEKISGTDAGACTQCGQCLPKCTQKLAIPQEMSYAHQHFGKNPK